MRTLRNISVFLILIATASFAAPRMGGDSKDFRDYLGGNHGGLSLGLIDPSRVTFSHSLQMGFVGFGGGSLMQSLYSTTANYRVSDPVSMSFTLGMMGTRFNGPGVPTMYKDVIGGASLDYRPTKDFHFRIEFARAPGYYGIGRYGGTSGLFGGQSPLSSEFDSAR